MIRATCFLACGVFFASLGGYLGAVEVPESATMEKVERKSLWDSPSMVSARLYMEEYFAASAEVTPEEVAAFWSELDAMSTSELKIWLAKFARKRQERARIAGANETTRQYKLTVAHTARRRSERISEEFNRAARQAARLAQTRVEKSFDRTSRHTPRRHVRYNPPRIWFWFRL